jgi:hypothetical protein
VSASTIIRWILSAALVYGIYTETGKWTAIFAFLVLAESELSAWYARKA